MIGGSLREELAGVIELPFDRGKWLTEHGHPQRLLQSDLSAHPGGQLPRAVLGSLRQCGHAQWITGVIGHLGLL